MEKDEKIIARGCMSMHFWAAWGLHGEALGDLRDAFGFNLQPAGFVFSDFDAIMC